MAKRCRTEQIRSSQYLQWNIYSLGNGRADFYHLLSEINSIILAKKFDDRLPNLLVNICIDDSYLNITSSLSPNPQLSLHFTSILGKLAPFNEITGICTYLLDAVAVL